MNKKIIPRRDEQQARVVRHGVQWYRTYGQRSAAAYLLARKVPRAVIDRVFLAANRREDLA